MKSGDVVRVKNKKTGEKVNAVVTQIQVDTEVIDVTRDGSLFPFVADSFYRSVPGRTTTTITLEVLP